MAPSLRCGDPTSQLLQVIAFPCGSGLAPGGDPTIAIYQATRYPGRTIFTLNPQVKTNGTTMAITIPITNTGMN